MTKPTRPCLLGCTHKHVFEALYPLGREHAVLTGRLPETYERVRSMPRTDTKACLPLQKGTLCGAGLLPPLLAPLAFQAKPTDCFRVLLKPKSSFEVITRGHCTPLDSCNYAVQSQTQICFFYFHLFFYVSGPGHGPWRWHPRTITISLAHFKQVQAESECCSPKVALCSSSGKKHEGYLKSSQCKQSEEETFIFLQGH